MNINFHNSCAKLPYKFFSLGNVEQKSDGKLRVPNKNETANMVSIVMSADCVIVYFCVFGMVFRVTVFSWELHAIILRNV